MVLFHLFLRPPSPIAALTGMDVIDASIAIRRFALRRVTPPPDSLSLSLES